MLRFISIGTGIGAVLFAPISWQGLAMVGVTSVVFNVVDLLR